MHHYKLTPHLTFKIWGGTWLKEQRAPLNTESDPLGETWEVSIHRDGVSKTVSGEKLSDLVDPRKLTYLVKFIDTADNLSIQVHPGDDYASRFERDNGKSECWLILNALPGAGIYLGLKKGVGRSRLKSAIDNSENVSELMNFHEVSPGDFFFVPAGSIHALGKDVLLAEIQQNSGVTYRVWDWNRVGMNGKPRDLHVKKAMDVINFEEDKNTLEYFKYSNKNFEKKDLVLTQHQDFSVRMITLEKSEEIVLTKKERALSIVNLLGEVLVGGELLLGKFESTISLDGEGEITLKAKNKSQFLVIS